MPGGEVGVPSPYASMGDWPLRRTVFYGITCRSPSGCGRENLSCRGGFNCGTTFSFCRGQSYRDSTVFLAAAADLAAAEKVLCAAADLATARQFLWCRSGICCGKKIGYGPPPADALICVGARRRGAGRATSRRQACVGALRVVERVRRQYGMADLSVGGLNNVWM